MKWFWGLLVVLFAFGCEREQPANLPRDAIHVPGELGGPWDREGDSDRDARSVVPGGSVAPGGPITPPTIAELGCAPLSFAGLASSADPAVAYVRTREETGEGKNRKIIGRGFGSAFVYDPNGYLLTNDHVIADATDIEVTLGSGRRLKGTVIGRDTPTDLAILRVDARNLPYLALGDSDGLRVGDWVMAIGNPFGLSHTVSVGIVSAKGRTRSDLRGLDETGYYDFVQTDASINPGNSGGPLLALSGKVVGINTAVRASANNIGFAVPISMVRELLPRLLRQGSIDRSAVGIVVSSVAREDVKRLELAHHAGALVRTVTSGGAGERAGLRIDDVITHFDGGEVAGPEQLRWMASIHGVGKRVAVVVVREGDEVELVVTLDKLDPPKVEPQHGDVLYP